jgi:hypothetical protein
VFWLSRTRGSTRGWCLISCVKKSKLYSMPRIRPQAMASAIGRCCEAAPDPLQDIADVGETFMDRGAQSGVA